MTDAQAAIVEEIASLLAEPENGSAPSSLASIEHTLTSGYAHALELEAERWRLDRRIGEVTARLGTSAAAAEELAALVGRVSRAEGDLRHLRALLAALRSRASALRANGATLLL